MRIRRRRESERRKSYIRIPTTRRKTSGVLPSVQDFFQARNKLIYFSYPVSLTRIGRSNNINEHIFKLCWTKREEMIRIDVDGMRRICMKNKKKRIIHTYKQQKSSMTRLQDDERALHE